MRRAVRALLAIAGLLVLMDRSAAGAVSEGAHRAYDRDRWHLFGRLHAVDGRRFDYTLTFFRYSLRAGTGGHDAKRPWDTAEFFPAALAITEEATGAFRATERVARDTFGMGGAASDALSVHADDWVLAARSGRWGANAFVSRAGNGAIGLDLVHADRGTLVVHGDGGVVRTGTCRTCVFVATSRVTIASRGTLRFDGATMRVEGTSWLDHDFGSREATDGEPGWDRFSVHLDDGRALMVFVTRSRADGPQQEAVRHAIGTLVLRDGTVRRLGAGNVAVTVRGGTVWHSPVTGIAYPSLWQIVVPEAGIDVSLAPIVAAQEIVPANAGGAPFWDGAVEVRDDPSGGAIAGWGHAELIGYDRQTP